MDEVIDYKHMKITKNEYRKKFFKRKIREIAEEFKNYKINDNIINGQLGCTYANVLDQLDDNPGFDKLIDLFICISNVLSCAKNQQLIETIQNDILSGKCQVIENAL